MAIYIRTAGEWERLADRLPEREVYLWEKIALQVQKPLPPGHMITLELTKSSAKKLGIWEDEPEKEIQKGM